MIGDQSSISYNDVQGPAEKGEDMKPATGGRRADGSRLPSIEIYEAVVDDGVRTPEEFAERVR